jgi:hypothetical protein
MGAEQQEGGMRSASLLRRLYPDDGNIGVRSALEGSAWLARVRLFTTKGLTYQERSTLLGQLRVLVLLSGRRGRYVDAYAWVDRKLRGLNA